MAAKMVEGQRKTELRDNGMTRRIWLSLLGMSGLAAPGPQPPKPVTCPLGHTKIEDLGALPVGMNGRISGDAYAPGVGWVPDYHMHVCHDCGVVFVMFAGEHARIANPWSIY
jgi:hypothetical protein